ncbi:MAG: NrsF family protein [Beijerinckiaceae bacterium]
MKTDDLIRALAADAPATPGAGSRRALLLLGASTLGVVALFALVFTLRPDLAGAGAWSTLRKLAFTLLLLAAGARGATALMRPDAEVREALVWFAAPLAALTAFITLDIAAHGFAGLGARAMGTMALQCLGSVALLSALPLAAFLYGLRNGASIRPGLAGAFAGAAAGGLAASLYALHCTDDSPFFVAIWYTLAVALVAIAGWLIGRRALRW